jgi:hypothetical protein
MYVAQLWLRVYGYLTAVKPKLSRTRRLVSHSVSVVPGKPGRDSEAFRYFSASAVSGRAHDGQRGDAPEGFTPRRVRLSWGWRLTKCSRAFFREPDPGRPLSRRIREFPLRNTPAAKPTEDLCIRSRNKPRLVGQCLSAPPFLPRLNTRAWADDNAPTFAPEDHSLCPSLPPGSACSGSERRQDRGKFGGVGAHLST